MTDTTASSDAKQSQPAASLSGSELDRLRRVLEDDFYNGNINILSDEFRPVILALLADFTSEQMERADAERQLQEALAERQQDRQRIADVTERYTEVVIGHARESYSAETVEYIFAPLLSPEAQPSSGGDEQ